MALGFNYTLSVDENESLRSLTKFLEQVQGQKVVLGLDFDMKALTEMLNKIQTEITNASKNLTLTFGSFRVDEDELQRTLKSAGQDSNMSTNVKVNVDESDLDGITAPFRDVPITLEREINKIKDSLIVSLNNLATTAQNNGLDNLIPVEEIRRSISELHNAGSSLSEIRKEASYVRQEISSWSQFTKGQAELYKTTAIQASEVADEVAKINRNARSDNLARQVKQLQQNLDVQLDNIKYSKEFTKLTKEQKDAFQDLANSSTLTATSLKRLKEEYQDFNIAIKDFKQQNIAPLINKQKSAFENLFGTISVGALAYEGIQMAMDATVQAFRDAIDYAYKMDEAYTNISKTMNVTQSTFDDWSNKASEIATNNGANSDSVIEMMKVYAQAGADFDKIKEQLEGATMFMNVSELDATTVANSLQSIMNQYNMASDTAELTAASMQKLGDVMVGVAYNMSKDETLAMQDIIAGVESAGAVVNSAGGDFEWFSAVVGTLSESMNAAGDETANAMKMIAARTLQSKEAISQLAETPEQLAEMEIAASNAEKALASIGVSVRTQTGEFRGLEDVLGEVADKWDTLNNTEQQMVSEKLAGNNRRNYFIALMEDYDRVIELQEKATTSTGMLMDASSKQAQSLEGVTNQLGNTLTTLYQTLIDGDELKSLIGTLDSFLQGLTKVVAFVKDNFIPVFTTLTGVILSTNETFMKLTSGGIINALIQSYDKLVVAITSATTATKLLQAAKWGLIGLVTGVVIVGIKKLIDHFKQSKTSAEELAESLDGINTAATNYNETMANLEIDMGNLEDVKKLKEDIEGLSSSSQEYKDKQDQINQSLGQYASSYPDIAPIIQNENIELGEKLRIIEATIEAQKRQAAIEAQEKIGNTQEITAMAENALKLVEEKMMLQDAIKQIQDAGADEFGVLNGEVLKVNVNGATQSLQELQEQLAAVDQGMAINESSMNNIIATYGNLAEMGLITQNEFVEVEDSMRKLAEAMGWSTTIIDQVADGMEKAEDATDTYGESAENAIDKIERLNEAMNKTINDAGDVNEQYVQTLNYLEEAGELMAKIEDGIDLSDMNDMLDSDLMEDYAGSYDDVASAIDHVKGKMGELQDKAYETYMNMQLADDDYWQQAVTSCAEALGVNEQEFADYVNSKGGMREVDVTNAENAAQAEDQANTDLVRQGLLNYAGYVTGKGDNRKTDMKNVVAFLNTQGAKEAQTIDQLATMWANYYNAKKKSINAEISQAKAMQGWAGDPTKRKTSAELAQLQQDIAALERANSMMTNYFGNVSTTFKDIGAGLSQSAANAGKAINDAIGSGYKSGKAGSGKGSSGKGSSGKGGSGSGSSTAQEVEDMESLVERYYEFEDVLRNVDKKLEKVRAERENITSKKDYEKSVKNEISLIKEQIKAMQNIQKEYQKERDEIKKTLKDNGFKFDKDGNISNYEKQLEKLTKQANKVSDPEKKKLMQEQVKALADLIERYNELDDETIPDTSTEIEDLKNQITQLTKDLAEQTEEVKNLGEAYYDLNREISDVNNALDMNEAKQEHATGQEKIDLLEEEIDLLRERQDLNEQEQKNAKKEANDLKNQLGKEGFKFDEDGNITNYQQIIDQLTKNANSLVGDDKQKALDDIEELIDLVNQYTQLTDETIPGLELDWQDYQNQIEDTKKTLEDLHQEEVEAAADAQKQVAEAYEHYLTERYNKVKEALKKEQEEYNKAYDDENFERTMADEQRTLDELAQQIAIYERDMSAAGQAKLAQLRAEYEAQRQAMNDMIRENEHEQTNEDFADQEQALDDALAEALDPAKLVQVVNDAIGSGLITIGDQVIELDDLMTTWLDETGDGLYAVGDTLKKELLDNLSSAKDMLDSMGLTNGSDLNLLTNARTLLDNAAGTANTMTGSITFGAPLLYVEGNVDEGSVEALTAEIQKLEQRIYENIANNMK